MRKTILSILAIFIISIGFAQNNITTVRGFKIIQPVVGIASSSTMMGLRVQNNDASGDAGIMLIVGLDTLIIQLDSNGVLNFTNGKVRFTDSALFEGGMSTISISADRIDLNPTTGIAHNEGTIFYDDDLKTFVGFIDRTDVALNFGEEQWIRVVNKTGGTLNDGQVIFVSGAQGNRPTVELAQADALSTSKGTIGILTEDINDNDEGIAATFGILRGFNTSTFTAGDKLYLSPSVAGAVTNVKPTAPDFIVRVGWALNSTNNGLILVSTHINGTGEDHSFIDQDVTSGSSPTFDGMNFTGLDSDSSFASIETDSVFEKTLNNGVVVDGALIKDNEMIVNLITSQRGFIASLFSDSIGANDNTNIKFIDSVVFQNPVIADSLFTLNQQIKIIGGTPGAGKVLVSDADGLATWETIDGNGIYDGNGSLSGNTTVTQGANTLAFTGSAVNSFSVDGATFSVDASANKRVGIGTASPGSVLDVVAGTNNDGIFLRSTGGALQVVLQAHTVDGGKFKLENAASSLNIVQFNQADPDFFNTGNAFAIGATSTASSRFLVKTLNAASGSYAIRAHDNASTPLFVVENDGNVGIGVDDPSTRLEVIGNAFVSNFVLHFVDTVTLGVAATTFVVTSNQTTMIGDGGGNTIATITGVPSGKGASLRLIFTDALITITDTDDGGSNTIDLGSAFTSADDTVLELEYNGTLWREVSRSVN